MSARTPYAARVAFASGGIFFALFALLHLLRPDLDPRWTPPSAYALGPFGWIMTLAFLAWAATAIALFLALRREVRSRLGQWGLGFLALGAFSPLLAAIFPMDALNTPPAAMTIPGMLHGFAAVLGDAFPLAALFLSVSLLRKNPLWSDFKTPLVLTTTGAWLAVLGLTASMALLLPSSGQLGPDVSVGWQMRLVMAAPVAWLMTSAWCAERVALNTRDGD